MNIKIQIFVILLALFAVTALINKIRKNQLELKYSLLWFVLAIGVLLLACFPSLTSWFAGVLGVDKPINLLFFAGFCFALLIIYSLTMAVSKLSVKVKRLTQELALSEKKYAEKKENPVQE